MLVNWIPVPSQVYIHTELPWVPSPSNSSTGFLVTNQAWDWLLSRAQTPLEKSEVEQERAYDAAHPGNLQAFGNGVDENTLLGWALIGVDPFHPYGPDDGLGQAIKDMVSGANETLVEKSNKERVKKVERQDLALGQPTPDATNPSSGPAPSPGGQGLSDLDRINQTLNLKRFQALASTHQQTSTDLFSE